MKPDFANASESFKRLNPHLFGVGSVEAKVAKSTAPQALVSDDAQHEAGARGVAVSVVFVVLQRRLLDDDNLVASLKPLRDHICESLEVDDADERIKFEYHQMKTAGDEGVLVKVRLQ